MLQSRRPRMRAAGFVIGPVLGLLGCYTVVNHPSISPQDRVTERGDVVGPSECAGCHTDADLWSFHHGAPWYGGGRDYYYYRYDPYLLRQPWYGDRYYYARWMAFYHHPWWVGGAVDYAWAPEPTGLGRGDPRDSADSVQPRFFPLGTSGPAIIPFTSAGQPVSTGFVGGSDPRSKRDSTDAQQPGYSRPVTVQPRYPEAPPPPVSAGSSSSNSQPQEKQASDDENKDQGNQERGRGDDRGDSTGSRSR